tara:strand:- start:93 stop:410 length:318 start_codon:yes stop_codon:yes gene_type:complete
MAQLNSKIKFYLEDKGKDFSNEIFNFRILNNQDGNGDFIHKWNVDGVDKPTDEQLATFESQANDWEANLPKIADTRASAKAKLIAGEALTEAEADVMTGGGSFGG